MNLLIVSASQRSPSQSRKMAAYLLAVIEQYRWFERVEVLDLGRHPLPLWDQGVWEGDPKWQKILPPVRRQVTEADAYVFIIPEWNGMATPAMKNFTLFWGERETGHKPALLIGVSSEPNGQYPIADMRAFGLKNNKWVFIPDHLVIRHVDRYFNTPGPVDEHEKFLRDRIVYSLKELHAYAELLNRFRERWVFDDRFKYAP